MTTDIEERFLRESRGKKDNQDRKKEAEIEEESFDGGELENRKEEDERRHTQKKKLGERLGEGNNEVKQGRTLEGQGHVV